MGLYPHILIGDRRPLTHSLSLSFLLSHSPPARAHLSSGACQTMGRFAMGGPKYKCHFARHLALATPVALVSLPSSPSLSFTTSLFHDDDSKCVSRSATRLVLSPSHSLHSRYSTSLYSSQVWRPVARGPPPLHSPSRCAPEHPRSVSRLSLSWHPPPLPVSDRRPDVDDGAPPLPLLPVSRLSRIAPAAIASVC